MSSGVKYQDPNIEKLYTDLLKMDLKNMAPEESSEAWEVIKTLYKKERRRRLKITITQIAVVLTASIAIGALIYRRKKGITEVNQIGAGI